MLEAGRLELEAKNEKRTQLLQINPIFRPKTHIRKTNPIWNGYEK